MMRRRRPASACRRRTLVGLAGLLVLHGFPGPPCLARGAVCAPGAEEARGVRAVTEGIITADNARHLERVLGFYAPDAVLMPPGEGPVIGREAIRPRYEDLFSRFDPHIVARIDEICVEGDLALVRGRNGGSMVSRRDGATRRIDDVYLMALRRDAGPDAGTGWRITHLIWHPAGPGDPGVPE